MIQLVIVRGLQGSGKSTWAKNWVKEDPEHRIRINWDDIRVMMGGEDCYWVPNREKIPFLNRVMDNMLATAFEHNIDVVIDNMNLNPKTLRAIYYTIAGTTSKDVQIFYKNILTPIEECIKRDAQRERPIGEKCIRTTASRYPDFYSETDEGTQFLDSVGEKL
jgi:predicted kinase